MALHSAPVRQCTMRVEKMWDMRTAFDVKGKPRNSLGTIPDDHGQMSVKFHSSPANSRNQASAPGIPLAVAFFDEYGESLSGWISTRQPCWNSVSRRQTTPYAIQA